MQQLYVVTPTFNDRPSLIRLLDELGRLQNAERRLHLVIVEDGSLSDPVRATDLHERPFSIELITLRRNMGHQRAIAVGLAHLAESKAPGYVAIMDSDGEDNPDDVLRLLGSLEAGEFDVVVAKRRKRQESPAFKSFYRLYRGVFRMLTGKEIRFGNFCVMTPRALHRLVHMEELWMHLPAAVMTSRLSLGQVETDRGSRYFGSSKMNLVSLITHGLRSVAVFIETVLTRIILFCAGVAAGSVLLILAALLIKVFGYATPNWLTIAVGALLGLLVQTATIALVSVLLAINTRNTPGLLPAKVALEYIDRLDMLPENA